MSWWSNWNELLPGLLPASYRGIRFHVIDADQEVGRRLLLTYFPGMDEPAADDFGALEGPVRLRALIVGDDYILRAQALKAAFQTPGVGTLMHPWLGEMLVLCEEPARIRFTDRELGVVWIDASFTPVTLQLAPIIDTAARVFAGADALIGAAGAYVGDVLGASLAVASLAQAQSAASAIAALVAVRVATAPEAVGLVPLVTTGVERVGSVIAGASS